MTAALLSVLLSVQAPAVLPRTHSHNDYLRARPLLEALDNGFASVEVDLFLVEDKLMVAHDRKDIRPDRTLESLYLRPLADRIEKGGGRVYAGNTLTLQVLVDLKADGDKAYEAFKKMLSAFPALQFKGKGSAVRFVISGDRPIDLLVRDEGKFAALDGRLDDLGKGYSREFMPMVSQAWLSHFAWVGAGAFPEAMQTKLFDMAAKVHAEGRTLRFWGAPDLPQVWQVHWQSGVDWINTDRPKELRTWMGSKLDPAALLRRENLLHELVERDLPHQRIVSGDVAL